MATFDPSTVSTVELEREKYRKSEGLKSVITSVVSALVLVAVITVSLQNSPGWQQVKLTFFNWDVFVQSIPAVGQGLLLNLQVLFFAVIGVAILGTLLALLRTSRSAVMLPLRWIAAFYTTIMRGIPMLVVLYLIGFGVPGLVTSRISPTLLGTVAVILSYSAYIAEVLRAGFNDVHPSQRAAARSLGLTNLQTIRMVVIPQALRKVAPALMNDFISMQKDVGLISTLGAVDAIRSAQIMQATTYNFTPYVTASVAFICLSVPFILLNDWYSARLRKRELNGGTV
ncbi:amino acid ABC transporter permease [Alloscardovia macacae]|uniref:ABC transporter permease n=1 Tax=Alloscardovia macacae TaxID=1160091 RepID=A0A1Y2T0H4_9BIFI|nr:amino acid ABC transporter permease [Alloscardovia macacae]OTA26959.1 ABC transporter permease [Alloscardovia macacae]OTA30053.1 ABC transporter permease [Alloscardovia macacae]OZG53688.1 ABC transporter permease [Alloscardovia macacae]